MRVNTPRDRLSRSVDEGARKLTTMQTSKKTPYTGALVRPLAGALALLLTAMLAGCSGSASQPYALTYADALDRYPGSDAVESAVVERFVRFFGAGSSSAEAARSDAEQLYADHLYFSDTLLTSEDKEQVVGHLTRMHEATESLSVTVLDTHRDGADFYIVWAMTAEFAPIRGTVTSHSIGVTHLRFDSQQRIVLHQDFWDAGAGFYEHIPLLGGAVRAIRGRFDD